MSHARGNGVLAGGKDVASAEATPQHLTLRAEGYERLGTQLQMNPPIRDAEHREGAVARVAQGVIDVSAPTMRRIRARKRPSPIPRARRA